MSILTLPNDLYPYQLEDAQKMANSDHNWLNFSEMGIGKTPEALWIAESRKAKHVLIACPNSLRYEWKRQIENWIGEGITAISHNDSYYKLEPIVLACMNGQRYMVMNYEGFRSKQNVDILSQLPIDLIIFDEIHKLRNPKTQQVEGSMNKLTREREGGLWNFLEAHKNVRVIGLSGSPIMNYPNDLYVPLSCIDREKWPRQMQPYKYFMYEYCSWSEGRYGSYVYGTRQMEKLRSITSPYIIRRTKKEVLPFLPEKVYRRVQLEMSPEQRKLYKDMEDGIKVLLDSGEPLWAASVLAALTRLRQINLDPKVLGISCPSAKTEFILDTIESTDEKIVIFSCFESYIYWLHLLLENKGVKHVMITGKVPPDKRSGIVKEFQEGDAQICLGTVQTMGEGITLTSASNLILADRWWNEPTNQQAVDRLHRIGQKNSVQIMMPICTNSVDEVLDAVLQRKYESSQEYYQENAVTRDVLTMRGLGGR